MVTWNTSLRPTCDFVVDAAKDADVLCLQEVTADSADWLQRALGSVFDVVTPTHCGRAWQGEQHGVAVAVRKAAFHWQKPRHQRVQQHLSVTGYSGSDYLRTFALTMVCNLSLRYGRRYTSHWVCNWHLHLLITPAHLGVLKDSIVT